MWVRYPAEAAPLPAHPHALDYQPPTDPKANPVALMLSNAIFVLTVLGFIPLHALAGRNIAVGLVSLLAFAIGTALAAPSAVRVHHRHALVPFSINALGLVFVTAYLIYFW